MHCACEHPSSRLLFQASLCSSVVTLGTFFLKEAAYVQDVVLNYAAWGCKGICVVWLHGIQGRASQHVAQLVTTCLAQLNTT